MIVRSQLFCLILVFGCRSKNSDLLDLDGDGVLQVDDCNDNDALVTTGLTWYIDSDADGFGESATTQIACTQPEGYADNDLDCDDGNADINPDADERCDSIDNDCNGEIDEVVGPGTPTWYADTDADGFGNALEPISSCEPPVGYVDNDLDCDDSNEAVNPDADEQCDSIDNNCDTEIDEATAVDASIWYADFDQDGHGDLTITTSACSQPELYVDSTTDCDDSNAQVSPDATEVCDGVDNNCDNVIDEDSAADALTWYVDSDSDGFGDSTSTTVGCAMPTGYVDNAEDCNDVDPSINPAASELCTASIDENCDGDNTLLSVDETTYYVDADGDGYGNSLFSITSCTSIPNYVTTSSDCNDLDADVHPYDATDPHTELCNGMVDLCENDWNGDLTPPVDEMDDDGDGYVECSLDVNVLLWQDSTATIVGGGDCDDTDVLAYPNATELCNGAFEDCLSDEYGTLSTPSVESDDDGDGFVECSGWDALTWEGPSSVIGGDDCNDDSNITYVGAAPNTDPSACLTDSDGDGVADRLWSLCPSELTSEEARWRIYGTTTQSMLGYTRGSSGVRSGFDADGDGINDVLFFSKSGTHSGYGDVVVAGSIFTDTDIEFDHMSVKDTVYLSQETTSRQLIPDMDGDGLAEVLTGSFWEWYDGVYRTGVIRLFLSTSVSALGVTDISSADADITWYGENDNGYLDAIEIGDLDGDGLADILFEGNAYNSSLVNQDRLYLVKGSSISGMSGDYNINTADIQFPNLNNATFVDVDGDGSDDVLAANVNSSNVYDSNEAYIFLSSTLQNNTELTSVDADFMVDINIGYASMGADMANAGDVDGDGLDDFLLQRTTGNGGDWVTHLFLAANLDWSAGTVDVVDSDYTFTGATCAYSYASSCHRSVDPVGDVDGDGLDDFILGWYNADQERRHSLFMSANLNPSTPDLTYQDGGYFFDWYQSVAPMGDIDGDGQDDFALASPYSDTYTADDGVIAIFSACPQ